MKKIISVALLFCLAHFVSAQAPDIVTGEIFRNYGDAPFMLQVNSNSPGAITFSLVSGDAISVTPEGEVTVLKIGTALVKASQEASPPFLAGSQNVSVVIKKANPYTTIISESVVKVGGQIQLQAQSYPPGANYTWSMLTQSGTEASISGSVLSAGDSSGMLEIRAELIADDNFEATSSTSTFIKQTIYVVDTGGRPAIVFNDLSAHYGDAFQLQASSNSPGRITYSVLSGDDATVTPDGMVKAIGVGTIVIQAHQADSGSFISATKTATLTIYKARGWVRMTKFTDTVNVGGRIQLQAQSTPPGATFSWSILSQQGTQANLLGDTLMAGNQSGILLVKAEIIPDDHFDAITATSTSAIQTVYVVDTAGLPKIVFSDFTASYGDSPFNVTASSNSPGTITYSVLSGDAATISPEGLVTVSEVGTVVIQLSQESGGSFVSTNKTATLTIKKASPLTTIISANSVGTGNKLLLKVQSYPPGANYTWSITSQSGTNASLSGDTLVAGPSIGSLNVRTELIPDEHFEASSTTSTYSTQTIHVVGTSGVPTITFGNVTKYYGDQNFYLDVNSTSPGEISYAVISGDAATIDPTGLVTIKNVGTVTIQVSQEASPPYEAVTYNTQLRIEGLMTGLDEEMKSNGLTVYPNPAKDVLNVAMPSSASDEEVETQLYHLNGTVSSPKVQNGTIYIADLDPGIYLLKLKYGGKEVHHRVVKQ